MISVANVSVNQATHYYKADDYYTADSPPTHWVGKLAETLALSGSPLPESFAKLLAGELPTGEKLHHGGGNRRAATDLTFSAPKSVSIAGLVAGDDRVIAAHEAAVRKVLDEVEKLVGARVTENRETKVITTGQAIFATVRHDTSRAGDPQLHTHSLLFNVTRLDDGRFRSIENKEIFRQRTQLDQRYKAELAKALVELGYSIRLTRDGFELAHISREQISAFSSRSKAIEDALEARGLSRKEASAQVRQVATRATRDRKRQFDRGELQSEWRKHARELKIDLESPASREVQKKEKSHVVQEALSWAVEHLGEREQAWSRSDLVDAAQPRALGFATAEELHGEISAQVQKGILIEKTDGTLTTQAAIDKEIRILETELAGRGAVTPILSSERLPSLDGYTEGQKAAITLAATTQNQIVGVQGYAGTGKTTMLKGFVEIAKEESYEVVGLASVRSAISAMRQANIESLSVMKWLNSGDAKLNDRTVLVLDEASLTSLSQFSRLMEKVESSGARLILLGDVAQYESVESGKVFHQLQESGMHTAVMDEIQRQKANPLLLEAAELAAKGQVREALKRLDVREFPTKTLRHEAIAEAYVTGNPDRTLVLTGTNADRKALNELIRSKLDLVRGGQETLTVFERTDMTAAQKKLADNYHLGTSVRFEKRYAGLGIEKGTIASVTGFRGNRIVLSRADGVEFQIDPARISSKGLSLGILGERSVANGEKVRFTASGVGSNGREFNNGDKGIVQFLPPENDGGVRRLSVVLDRTGQSIELDQSTVGHALDYGYTQTGHSAQGLGEETLLIDRDPNARTTSERAFYTDLTRATHEAVVFTSDREKLADALTREVSKSTALEPDLFPPETSKSPEIGINQFASLPLGDESGSSSVVWGELQDRINELREKVESPLTELPQSRESSKKLESPEIQIGD